MRLVDGQEARLQRTQRDVEARRRRELGRHVDELVLREPVRCATVLNVCDGPDYHYVVVFMSAVAEAGEPQNLEPHKCKGWSWMSFDEIKAIPDEKLFIPFRHFIKYAEKHSLFDDNDKTPRRLKRGDTDKSHVASVAESVAKLEQVVAEGGSRPTSPASNLNASTPGSA